MIFENVPTLNILTMLFCRPILKGSMSRWMVGEQHGIYHLLGEGVAEQVEWCSGVQWRAYKLSPWYYISWQEINKKYSVLGWVCFVWDQLCSIKLFNEKYFQLQMVGKRINPPWRASPVGFSKKIDLCRPSGWFFFLEFLWCRYKCKFTFRFPHQTTKGRCQNIFF